MTNPFATRFREAAFTLEETSMPEIAEMLHIAAREIERQEDLLNKAQRPTAADMAKQITAQVDRFLSWPIPKSVCSDLCVTDNAYPHQRYGTSLLSAHEAKQMLEYLSSGGCDGK